MNSTASRVVRQRPLNASSHVKPTRLICTNRYVVRTTDSVCCVGMCQPRRHLSVQPFRKSSHDVNNFRRLSAYSTRNMSSGSDLVKPNDNQTADQPRYNFQRGSKLASNIGYNPGQGNARGGSETVDNFEINANILAFTSGDELFNYVDEELANFNFVNAATALSVATQLYRRNDAPRENWTTPSKSLRSLETKVHNILELRQQNMKENQKTEEIDVEHVNGSISYLSADDDIEVSTSPTESPAITVDEGVSIQGLSSVVFGFSSMGYVPSNSTMALLDKEIASADIAYLKAFALGTIIISLARLRYRPSKECASNLLAGLENELNNTSIQFFFRTLWGMQSLNLRPSPTFWSHIESKILTELEEDESNKRKFLAEAYTAMAKFQYRPSSQFIETTLPLVREKLSEFHEREIPLIIWALGVFHPKIDEEFYGEIEDLVRRHAESAVFGKKGLCNSLWLFGRLSKQRKPKAETVHAIDKSLLNCVDRLDPGEVWNALSGFALLGYVPNASLITRLEDKVEDNLTDLKLSGLVTCFWSFSSLGIVPRDDLLRKLTNRILGRLRILSPMRCSDAVHAFAKFGVRLSDDNLRDLEYVLSRSSYDLNVRIVQTFLATFIRHKYVPSLELREKLAREFTLETAKQSARRHQKEYMVTNENILAIRSGLDIFKSGFRNKH